MKTRMIGITFKYSLRARIELLIMYIAFFLICFMCLAGMCEGVINIPYSILAKLAAVMTLSFLLYAQVHNRRFCERMSVVRVTSFIWQKSWYFIQAATRIIRGRLFLYPKKIPKNGCLDWANYLLNFFLCSQIFGVVRQYCRFLKIIFEISRTFFNQH